MATPGARALDLEVDSTPIREAVLGTGEVAHLVKYLLLENDGVS